MVPSNLTNFCENVRLPSPRQMKNQRTSLFMILGESIPMEFQAEFANCLHKDNEDINPTNSIIGLAYYDTEVALDVE